MAWEGSDRRYTLPRDWPARVTHVLNRDNHECQHLRTDTGRLCRLPARAVDHIVPHHEGGTDDEANLQALCDWHHGKKSGAEGGRASGRARAAKKAAAKTPHPGLMPPPEERPPF